MRRISDRRSAHATKIDAEVLLGKFLKETEKNQGAKGIGKSAVPDGNRTPSEEPNEYPLTAYYRTGSSSYCLPYIDKSRHFCNTTNVSAGGVE